MNNLSSPQCCHLPSVLVEIILTYLPLQTDRIRSTATCKTWLECRKSYAERGILWRRLRCITVRAGRLIKSIRFAYSDRSSCVWGDKCLEQTPNVTADDKNSFYLSENEELFRIEMINGDIIRQIRFMVLDSKTGKERCSRMFGYGWGYTNTILERRDDNHDALASLDLARRSKGGVLGLGCFSQFRMGYWYIIRISSLLDSTGSELFVRNISRPTKSSNSTG